MSHWEGCGGVAGEGRVVDVPKFHSWGKCTMPLRISTQIGCPMLPLAWVLYCLRGSFKLHLGGVIMQLSLLCPTLPGWWKVGRNRGFEMDNYL